MFCLLTQYFAIPVSYLRYVPFDFSKCSSLGLIYHKVYSLL